MKKEEHRINKQIRVPEVRLVGDNVENGIYSTLDALSLADEMYLDLVEISSNANPPVCKMIDYQKFLYDKKKKEKEMKKIQKANQIEVKEIRMTPNTDDHDFNFKLNHAIRFLKDNNKVKVTVFYKGREIMYQENGEIMILKFAEALKDYGTVETLPKLEGKRLSLIIKPLFRK